MQMYNNNINNSSN